ncbi:unnamed protein product [Trichogramma brassicae]|uniref:Tudor domain-containing protein n=1 Tax=Trichogramma brassicae TaxID=86971 RepID=A0A6H5I6M1_9HYME|nr:unnamed protein product [Trichogramma brassicae]
MSDLQTHKLQLQQVEAALTTDPGNEELIKLKIDLEEIIELHQDLLKSQQQEKKQTETDEDEKKLLAELAAKWKVGDQCMALWSEDGKYYEATIDAISEDGSVNVTFNEYKNKRCYFAQVLEKLRKNENKKRINGLRFLPKRQKGVVKKSIFATPENINGRVGIGTCGVSGKEMTKYTNGEKWRRGT